MKRGTAISYLVSLGLTFSSSALAAIKNPINSANFSDLLTKIADGVLTIAIGIAPIMIVVGAFYFVTAGGNAERVKTGKDILLYAIIGLVIAAGAKGLILWLKGII
ncbi:hypothetical protein KKG36_00610 [Patescibacteria group bacterium]|nr:hypothetical protein [Patescibacteria group bacterium]